MLIEYFPDPGQLGSGCASIRQDAEKELRRGAAENPIEHVINQGLSGLSRRHNGTVYVGPIILIALQHAFAGHCLHRLQHAGIHKRPRLGKLLMDFPNGGWPSAPEDFQDFEFSVGWSQPSLLWRSPSSFGIHNGSLGETERDVNDYLRTMHCSNVERQP